MKTLDIVMTTYFHGDSKRCISNNYFYRMLILTP